MPEGVTPEDGLTLAQLEEKGRELERTDPGLDRSDGGGNQARRSRHDHLHLGNNRRAERRDAHARESRFKSDRLFGPSFIRRGGHSAFSLAAVSCLRAAGDVHVPASRHGRLFCGVVADGRAKHARSASDASGGRAAAL